MILNRRFLRYVIPSIVITTFYVILLNFIITLITSSGSVNQLDHDEPVLISSSAIISRHPLTSRSAQVFQTSRRFSRSEKIQPLPKSRLLNLTDFRYINKPSKECEDDVFLSIFVHTSPENIDRRKLIRRTWAQPKSHLKLNVVFLIGETFDKSLQTLIDVESRLENDIVQGTFTDSYRNLTYKHLMGYKWTLENCLHAKYVMKVDDDAFVDIYGVVDILSEFEGDNFTFLCSLFPEGSQVQRTGKWRLSLDEFKQDALPKYCSGIAYFTSFNVILDVFRVASEVKPFIWIDDLFVTGIIAAHFNDLKHTSLNRLFTYKAHDLRKWLKGGDERSPWIIGDIGDENDWMELMERLWAKTNRAWNSV